MLAHINKMANVIMYTKDYCPYCVKAKTLLSRKGVKVKEIDITHDEAALAEMLAKAGGRKTVPQIFIGNTHVGGCDDLYVLEGQGKLEALLKG